MKLVQTLVVRDEVDIIDAQISYHLGAGVDFVLAPDHDSHDGTTNEAFYGSSVSVGRCVKAAGVVEWLGSRPRNMAPTG